MTSGIRTFDLFSVFLGPKKKFSIWYFLLRLEILIFEPILTEKKFSLWNFVFKNFNCSTRSSRWTERQTVKSSFREIFAFASAVPVGYDHPTEAGKQPASQIFEDCSSKLASYLQRSRERDRASSRRSPANVPSSESLNCPQGIDRVYLGAQILVLLCAGLKKEGQSYKSIVEKHAKRFSPSVWSIEWPS